MSTRRDTRYKIPQNIDMQDRIMGPLTMVQFIYAVVGSGFCYSIYKAIPAPASYGLIVPLATFTAAMVFLKINERPFWDFFISVIEFMSKPKQMVWRHEDMPDLKVEIYHTGIGQNKQVSQTKHFTRAQLTEYADKIDSGEGGLK